MVALIFYEDLALIEEAMDNYDKEFKPKKEKESAVKKSKLARQHTAINLSTCMPSLKKGGSTRKLTSNNVIESCVKL